MKPTAQLLRQSDKGFHRVNKSLSYNGAAAERPLLQQHRRHPFPPQPRHQRVLQGVRGTVVLHSGKAKNSDSSLLTSSYPMSIQTEDPVFINTSMRNMSKGIENEDKEERNKKKNTKSAID